MKKRTFLCICVLFFSYCDSQLINIIDGLQQLFNSNSDNIDSEPVIQKSYDFIIIGAGSAGSVVANRLSENQKWSVLLLEAGRNENFFTDVPLMAAFQSATSYNWGYKGEKSNTSCLSLKNGRCNVPRGKAVGGTSVINLLIYNRGNKLDYDEWKDYGNTGWGYEDILSYFIKSENCSSNVEADRKFHGQSGYLSVQYPPFHTPMPDKFIKAGVGLGFRNTDPNGRFHMGFSRVQATMQNGRRHSAAKAFITPVKNRRNLDILTEARVTKILVDPRHKRAYAIEFIRNRNKYRARADKEIILSAGAINSPQLLMLSGIGPREELERFNIPVIQNLKVGHNLQDHVSYVHSFLVNESVTVSDLRVQNPIHVINYIFNGKGPMTIPGGAEALAFIKTKRSVNKDDDYPDIEFVLGAGGFNNDFYGSLRNLFGVSNNLFYDIYGPALFTPAFSISTILLKPRSKGRVTLKSSNPLQAPAIHLNYFVDEFDVQVMVEGLKMVCIIILCNVISFDLELFKYGMVVLITN